MSAYFVANIRVKDEAAYQAYLDEVDGVFSQFNGTYLSVDPHPEVVEGNWSYSRLVLIQFPDKAALKRWYESDAYQTILKHRLAGADCDSIIVE